MAGEISYAYVPFSGKGDDSQRIVEGYVSSPGVDCDEQIVDQGWLKGELPTWLARWGNIRAQHDPSRAVGKAQAVDLDTTPGPYLAAKIVDDDAWRKVKEGVYNGFSVGIKGPRIVSDPLARNGRIVGGTLVEISIVDRPANDAAKFVVLKRAGAREWKDMQSGAVIADGEGSAAGAAPSCECGCACAPEGMDAACVCACAVCQVARAAPAAAAKRNFTAGERQRLAESGAAEADGSFPITDAADLEHAIRDWGRAGGTPEDKAHIIARARALGRLDLLPYGWAGEGAGDTPDSAAKHAARGGAQNAPDAVRAAGAAGLAATKAASDFEAGNRSRALVRPGVLGEVAAVLQDALQRIEALAGETDQDRDGDVDFPTRVPEKREQSEFQAGQHAAPRPETLELTFATEADLKKYIGATVADLTRAASADTTAATGEVLKLTGGIAKGLAALADQTEATTEGLTATRAALGEVQAELARVKALAQPVRGAVFAVDKGLGLEPDRFARGDAGAAATTADAARLVAGLGEEEKRDFFASVLKAMYGG